jgi:hypothetical protein
MSDWDEQSDWADDIARAERDAAQGRFKIPQKADTMRRSLDDVSVDEWTKSNQDYLASKRQVGGDHYKEMVIQPLEFVVRNNLGFCEANAIKYVCRHHAKGGVKDIDKAIHYLQLLKEFKYGEE